MIDYDEVFQSLNAIEIQEKIIDIEESETESESILDLSGRSHIITENWNYQVAAAIAQASAIDPYEADIPIGSIVPAAQAVGWVSGQRSCDIRPRLVDKSSGIARLLDSGSQVSTTMRGPDDVKDAVSRLVAVNGTKIDTFGVREVKIKIGRKCYTIDAVVCDDSICW